MGGIVEIVIFARRIYSSCLRITIVIFLGAFVVPGNVIAGVIQIEIEGDLTQTQGSDIYNLDGAHFFSVYRYDTTTSAFLTIVDPDVGEASNAFDVDFDFTTITNRPNGAMDYQYTGRGLLRTSNQFPPNGSGDQFSRLGDGLTGDLDGLTLGPVAFVFDIEFFSGELPVSMPIFSQSDVQQFFAPSLRDGPVDHHYQLDAPIYVITQIPVPAAIWLFGSALGLLGWMRRKEA
jgi:hypothetical protein